MARKPKIQCRIERDTDEAITRYMDDLDDDDISQSEVVRHLIRAGLAEKGHPVAATDGHGSFIEQLASPRTVIIAMIMTTLSIIPMVFSAELLADGSLPLAVGMLILSTVLLVTAAITIWAAALAQITLAQPLRNLILPERATA